MYYNNANNNTEKTTEHTREEQAFLKALSMPRVSLLKKMHALRDSNPDVNIYDDSIDYVTAMEEENHTRLKLAASLYRRPEFMAVFASMYALSAYIHEHLDYLIDLLTANAPKKAATSKAVVDNPTLDYALSLVNGTVSRAKNTAESLKQAALWLAYYKDSANPMEYTAVDNALNKVFAAVRRQAKKNAVEISAKSNKVTKDAVKLAVMERIREMQANHEYEFEVLIGEA